MKEKPTVIILEIPGHNKMCPTYDYRCESCCGTKELILSVKDRFLGEEDACESCGGKYKLTIGAPAIVDPIRVGRGKVKPETMDVLKHINKKHGGHMNL